MCGMWRNASAYSRRRHSGRAPQGMQATPATTPRMVLGSVQITPAHSTIHRPAGDPGPRSRTLDLPCFMLAETPSDVATSLVTEACHVHHAIDPLPSLLGAQPRAGRAPWRTSNVWPMQAPAVRGQAGDADREQFRCRGHARRFAGGDRFLGALVRTLRGLRAGFRRSGLQPGTPVAAGQGGYRGTARAGTALW